MSRDRFNVLEALLDLAESTHDAHIVGADFCVDSLFHFAKGTLGIERITTSLLTI